MAGPVPRAHFMRVNGLGGFPGYSPALSIRLRKAALCTSVFRYSFRIFGGKNLKIIAFEYLHGEFEELGSYMNRGRL